MKWFSLLSVVFLMLTTLLCASPVAYADDPPDEEPEMKVDIGIDGDLEVDISVSGPAELNAGVEGPSQVHIEAGDEVKLNVEASDESRVFVDDDKVNDNPGEDLDNPSLIDGDSSRLNSMAIISGVFAAAGLLAFFLVRRKRKEGR